VSQLSCSPHGFVLSRLSALCSAPSLFPFTHHSIVAFTASPICPTYCGLGKFSSDHPITITFPLLEAPGQPKEAQASQCNTLKLLRVNRCVDPSDCLPLLDAEDLSLQRPCLLCSTLLHSFCLFCSSKILHPSRASMFLEIHQQAFHIIFNFLPTIHLADHRAASRQTLRAGPWSRQSNR
jgi:hypothetical protein